MTLPVRRKGLGFQKISEVRICREGSWSRKHLASLKSACGRAPFFPEHLPFLEELFSGAEGCLLTFNLAIIRYILKCLELKTKLVLLSETGVEAREPELTVELCRRMGAGTFLAQRAARKFLDEEALRRCDVRMKFFVPHAPIYPQLYGDFIANLSALDLLFTCGPKATEILRSQCIGAIDGHSLMGSMNNGVSSSH